MRLHRHTDGGTIQRNRSSSIQEHQCFWVVEFLKRKNNRDTIRFNVDASNTELLFRTIHSANLLSIYGAISSWCEKFGLRPNEREMTSERFVTKENEQILKDVKPQEVNSLVQTPRSNDPVSGNRLRESLRNFETLQKEIQFTKVCDDAPFFKRVSVGMCHNTVADVDDGFGDRTPACRQYSHPRACVRFQTSCRNPRTNFKWTSSSSSHCTISWHTWNWNVDSIHDNARSKFLDCDMPRKESLRGWVTSQRSRTQSHEKWITFGQIYCKRKWIFVLQSWSSPASRKLLRRRLKFWRIQCTVQKKLFLSEKGSRMTFMSANLSKETLFQSKSQKWSWDWYVVMI